MPPRSLAQQIRMLYHARGYTNDHAFSKAAGIDPSMICNVNRRNGGMTVPTLIKVADALEVSLDELCQREFPKGETV